MKKYFSVGEAAKAVHTTSETLRYYDRIGLVRPSKKDEWTNYRYRTGYCPAEYGTGFAAYGLAFAGDKKGFRI